MNDRSSERMFGGYLVRKAMRVAAEEVGGEVVEGRSDSPIAVQLPVDQNIITLDLVRSSHNDAVIYHRLRAPFFNAGGLRFRLHRASFFSRIAKWLGMRDCLVGNRPFDNRFIVRSVEPRKVRALFGDGRILSIIYAQPNVRLAVEDDGGRRLDPFPPGVDELRCIRPPVEDAMPLVRLFELFQIMLPKLEGEERKGEDVVTRHIRRLRRPGGTIREGELVLWEGDDVLHEAAEALRELGDARAVGALVAALHRADPALQARATDALARIGNPRAIRSLVPMLGEDGSHDGKPLRTWAGEALETLGEGALADALLDALRGHPGWLPDALGMYRPQAIRALETALSSASGHHAARALATIDAVEALPKMRDVMRALDERSTRGKALAAAITELEARAALPRPAHAPAPSKETLPRPAGAPEPDPERLPRPADGPEPD